MQEAWVSEIFEVMQPVQDEESDLLAFMGRIVGAMGEAEELLPPSVRVAMHKHYPGLTFSPVADVLHNGLDAERVCPLPDETKKLARLRSGLNAVAVCLADAGHIRVATRFRRVGD